MRWISSPDKAFPPFSQSASRGCPVERNPAIVHGTRLAHRTRHTDGGAGKAPCSTRDLLGRGLISIDLDASYTFTRAHGRSGEPFPFPVDPRHPGLRSGRPAHLEGGSR
jgi:hypothetical protein